MTAVAWIGLVLAFLAFSLAFVALVFALEARRIAREAIQRNEEQWLALSGAIPPRPSEAIESSDPLDEEVRRSEAYRRQRGL